MVLARQGATRQGTVLCLKNGICKTRNGSLLCKKGNRKTENSPLSYENWSEKTEEDL